MADRPKDAALYAVVAEFDRPDALLAAVRAARDHGFPRLEAFSPFPVKGLAEALGFRERAIAPAMLAGAIVGAATGYFMQVWVNLDFPLNIGGRPVVAPPAFALITYELMVLGAVSFAVLAMLIGNRLPRLHHPLFEIAEFHFATDDKFFLAILAGEGSFDAPAARRFLKTLDPLRVAEAPYAETAP
jgi:asparagine N-glycosylation enzyme membrane subunit Stt3